MNTAELKIELYQLIEAISDSKTLKAIHAILSAEKKQNADWWETISTDEKRAIQTGLEQLKNGKGVPHTKVREKVDALLYKKP